MVGQLDLTGRSISDLAILRPRTRFLDKPPDPRSSGPPPNLRIVAGRSFHVQRPDAPCSGVHTRGTGQRCIPGWCASAGGGAGVHRQVPTYTYLKHGLLDTVFLKSSKSTSTRGGPQRCPAATVGHVPAGLDRLFPRNDPNCTECPKPTSVPTVYGVATAVGHGAIMGQTRPNGAKLA